MPRNRLLILAAVVAVVVIGAGVLIARGIPAGGGRQVAIDLRVTGASMAPAAPAARQGDRVTMTVTADAKEEIHLHGYDVMFEVDGPGGRVTKTFTADRTGTFEIEIETTGKHLGDFTVSP